MKKITFACLLFSLSFQSLAIDLQVDELQGISSEKVLGINSLISRNLITGERPASCPLKSVKNFELVNKINTIKTLFNNDCLDKNQERLNNILAGAQDIQSSIDQYNQDTQTQQTQIVDTNQTQISGEQIVSVVSGLSNIFQGNSCDSLKYDQSFLEQSSSVISEIAKIGLATNNSNGLIISAGGFALSSVLTAIDSLFDKRFDFEKAESRQSFIKLNCAFYDIRRDIHNSGFLDVSTTSHSDDLALATREKAGIQKSMAAIEARYNEIQNNFKNENLLKLNSDLTGLINLKTRVAKISKVLSESSKSSRLDQLNIINTLTWDVSYIESNLSEYKKLNIQHIDLFNNTLEQLLARMNVANTENFNGLVSASPSAFFNDYLPNMIFHLSRIYADISNYETTRLEKTQKNLKVNGQTYAEFKKALAVKKEKLLADAQKIDTSLDQVITRLSRITGNGNFVRGDDGSENIVDILDDYDAISKQVYGTHGLNFLDSMVRWSMRENNNFNQEYQRFINDYNLPANGDLSAATLSDYEMKGTCQSALPLRRKWNFAKSLAEQGYDFVATNVDLFSGNKNSNKYLGELSLVENKSRRRLSVRDEILYHEKSAYIAKSVIAGQSIPHSAQEVLLNNRWLGQAMMDIEASQLSAGIVQKVIERFNCLKTLEMD